MLEVGSATAVEEAAVELERAVSSAVDEEGPIKADESPLFMLSRRPPPPPVVDELAGLLASSPLFPTTFV
jgi:hypothetical protein